jgi:hypothetical protein
VPLSWRALVETIRGLFNGSKSIGSRNGGKIPVGLGGRVRIIFSRQADLKYWQKHYG